MGFFWDVESPPSGHGQLVPHEPPHRQVRECTPPELPWDAGSHSDTVWRIDVGSAHIPSAEVGVIALVATSPWAVTPLSYHLGMSLPSLSTAHEPLTCGWLARAL